MKATVIHEFGDFDVLKYEDIETPKPKPSYVPRDQARWAEETPRFADIRL